MLHPCQTATLLELLLPSLGDQNATVQPAPKAQAGRSAKDILACQIELTASAKSTMRHGAGYLAPTQPDGPPAADGHPASWPLRYMLAWWSIVGPLVKLALPANTLVQSSVSARKVQYTGVTEAVQALSFTSVLQGQGNGVNI